MGESSDIQDIHDFVKMRLEKEGIRPESNPEATYKVIEKACSDYLVRTDHDTVQQYEYHYIMAVRIGVQISESHRLYMNQTNKVLSALGDAPMSERIIIDYADRVGRYAIGNTVTLVYSMAYEFADDLLGELIVEQISDDVPESGKNAIKSQINSYNGRADTLVACNVLDPNQNNTLKHISDVRAALVHDVQTRFTLSILNDLNEMNRIPHLLNDLYGMVYNEPAFQYYDDVELDEVIDDG